MKAKIMIAMIAMFGMILAGCSVMADPSEGEPGSTATIHYQDDNGKDLLIVPFETDANGKVYTVLGWDEMNTDAPEGKVFVKWIDDTTKTDANANYLLKANDKLVLKAQFEFKTLTVTLKDGETVCGTYTADISEDEGVLKYPILSEFKNEEGKTLADYEPSEIVGKQFIGISVDGETVIKEDTVVSVVWNPIFKVSWMVGDFIVSEGTTKTVDGKMELNIPEIPSKANFDFKGWKVGDVLVAHDSVEDFEFTGDTVFVAEFVPATLSVTFMDGEKVVLKTTVLYGQTISEKDIPAGYEWDFDFSEAITEDVVIQKKTQAPVEEPEDEPDNTGTYVAVALFGVFLVIGLALGIRHLKA